MKITKANIEIIIPLAVTVISLSSTLNMEKEKKEFKNCVYNSTKRKKTSKFYRKAGVQKLGQSALEKIIGQDAVDAINEGSITKPKAYSGRFQEMQKQLEIATMRIENENFVTSLINPES